MSNPLISYHLDGVLFRDAVRFTAAETGFNERLIEKDYYCSVALADLCAPKNSQVVFKGGTCLAKVHADFLRLSEDLDFAVSTSTDTTRSQRSRSLDDFKSHFASISDRCDCFRIADALCGFNSSLQYGARLTYKSMVTGQDESMKIEVSVREPIIESYELLPTRTLLLDPFRIAAAVAPFETPSLSIREAYAEKLRAALSRREPAIRDFFDLGQAFLNGTITTLDDALMAILKEKLSIPENEEVDLSQEKLDQLRAQLETQLRPLLRSDDYASFDLEQAFRGVVDVAKFLDR